MGLMVRSAALAFALFAGVVVSAGAAASGASDQAGPFEGTFEGTASGAGGTTAPMTLTLVQRGSEVTGTASLGDGLYVTSTRCGGAPVPAGTVQGSGQTLPDDPRHVDVATAISIQGFTVPVSLVGRARRPGLLRARSRRPRGPPADGRRRGAGGLNAAAP